MGNLARLSFVFHNSSDILLISKEKMSQGNLKIFFFETDFVFQQFIMFQAPFYRAFVQDGLHVYAKRNVGDVGCVIVACKTEDPKSCVYK